MTDHEIEAREDKRIVSEMQQVFDIEFPRGSRIFSEKNRQNGAKGAGRVYQGQSTGAK